MAIGASEFQRRLIGVAAIGGVVAVAVLAVFVLRVGFHDPSPPSLEADPRPEIPGSIAFVSEDGCVVVAEASGSTRQWLRCGMDWVAFIDPATIEYGRWAQPATAYRRDLATGTETPIAGGKNGPNRGPIRPESSKFDIQVYPNGDVYAIDGAVRTRIYDCDCPESSAPDLRFWSPDGKWVLLTYYPRGGGAEIWVLAVDGSVAGTLAKGTRGDASWAIPGVGVAP